MISKQEIIKQMQVLWPLAKTDFKSRYLGSAIGTLWAFLLPLLNLCIMWFAFEVGLKAPHTEGVPFILWIVTGLFPWTFFSDATNSAMNSIIEKSFLVKKMVFRVEFLPLIKILSTSFVFIFLNVLIVMIFIFNHQNPTLHWVQLLYYAFCLIALVLSLSWLTSSIVVFYRDLGQVISVCLQLGFWATPIFWSTDLLPPRFHFVIYINPVTYVINGYRDAMLSKSWFWQEPASLFIFWCFVIFFSIAGLILFKKLRPHFADVL